MQWIISKAKWYHANDGDIPVEDLITLTDEEYSAIMAEYNKKGKEFYVENKTLKVRDMKTYSQEFYDSQSKNSEALSQLNSSDWKVIRELERKYLAGTELNKEREALRKAINHFQLPDSE